MNKLFNWCRDNIFFLFTLFLLAFIPLYPKLPLVNIRHVWVYVRVEDFIVLFVLLCWGLLVVRNKSTLKTPLTVPILIFWIIGAIATIHSILLIFPGLQNVFPNVAFLSFLRRIEYMSLFFISYCGMKDKRFLSYFIVVLTVTFFLIIGYGIGQKYLGFYAFLTMNEEFAKGIALQLSSLSRVSSTFGGHYDLAAYLVLVIPIMASLVFGYRNWLVKATFIAAAVSGLFVLFMTVSRISFFALFVSLGLVLFFQKKKLVLFLFPIIAVAIILLLSFLPSLSARFGSTIKEIDVLLDAKTGKIIGHVKEVPNTYFEKKIVKQQFSQDITNLDAYAGPFAVLAIPYTYLPEKVMLLVEPNAPTGEDLPQGTGYINLPLSPIIKRLGNFYYERKPNPKTGLVEVFTINGDYLIKKVLTYDLSFTTRFQGEWPHAITAFKRNVLFGSGYGSVSLAVDNSYLRMLAEVGVLGFASFLAIFIIIGIYIRKTLPAIESRPVKSFIFGFIAGIVGLAINGLFIDVFEASKIAFTLWLLTGVAIGILRLYQHVVLDVYKELKKVATSTYAIMVYLLIATVLLFSSMTRNFFVGDDFTWFRWAADCGNHMSRAQRCQPTVSTIIRYFTQSDGFFYRPGAKTYFLFMYQLFWLNQTAYHLVSLFLHFTVSILVFLLAKKIFRNTLPAVFAAFLFLMLSGFSEAIFWISATGFLFTACFTLSSLLLFITWREKKKTIYFIATVSFSILSLLFHELGIVTPFLFLLYQWIFDEQISLRGLWKDIHYRILFLPIPIYLGMRFIAGSHWLSGDYNYNLLKLPFNITGNAIGYLFLTLIGPFSEPFYQTSRNFLRGHAWIALLIVVITFFIAGFVYKKTYKLMKKNEIKVFLFGMFFSIITLLPFLGLGNISSRYSYLSSIGITFLLVFFINKLYVYLLDNGRDIALASIVVVVSVFCLLQIIQLQQVHSDWYEAGEKTKSFFVAIDSVYIESWASDAMEFHFVNVPIRHGQAWVFPVGLPDALWFVFRNPNIKVFIWPSLAQAFSVVPYDSNTKKVFVFDQDGTVTEIKKPPSTQ